MGMSTWFRKKAPDGPAAAELLAEAERCHADGRFAEGVERARRALERREREVGELDASLQPYLLTLAGLLYLTSGWASGLPFYDRAQRLRAAVRAPRVEATRSRSVSPAHAPALLLAAALLASAALSGCAGASAAPEPPQETGAGAAEPHPFVCD